MPESRSARFAVVRPAASVRLTVDGLPGKDYTITERGRVTHPDTQPAAFPIG